MTTLTLNLNPTLILDDEQFISICKHNQNFNFERNQQGELIIMPPTGSETSDRNAGLTYQLRAWNRQNQLGKSFDSSGGFKLPNGAERSPDASWVKMERWNALTQAQKERWNAFCGSAYRQSCFPRRQRERNLF